MFKRFKLTCPTKDKTVVMNVEYIPASAIEDRVPIYTLGKVRSCSGNDVICSNCKHFSQLPREVR